MTVSTQEENILATLLAQARMMHGGSSAPCLLRTAAALVEQAGYEIARTEATGRVTQLILLAAELERLGAVFEKDAAATARKADWQVSGRG